MSLQAFFFRLSGRQAHQFPIQTFRCEFDLHGNTIYDADTWTSHGSAFALAHT